MRDETVIQEEMKSAKKKAEELDESGEHMNAIMAMSVYHTLQWVTGEGSDDIDEELLKLSEMGE